MGVLKTLVAVATVFLTMVLPFAIVGTLEVSTW